MKLTEMLQNIHLAACGQISISTFYIIITHQSFGLFSAMEPRYCEYKQVRMDTKLAICQQIDLAQVTL